MSASPRRHPGLRQACERRLHIPLLIAVTLALLLRPSGAAADTSIAPGVAGLFVDEDKIVEGPVTAAERDAGTVRLSLGNPPQTLTVSLIIGLLSNFPPEPERYYLGKTVRVAGTIRSFRGALEMVVHDPAHIEVADTSTIVTTDRPAAGIPALSGATTSGRVSGDAAGPDTIDALKQRVRELEDKVRQLEQPGHGAQ